MSVEFNYPLSRYCWQCYQSGHDHWTCGDTAQCQVSESWCPRCLETSHWEDDCWVLKQQVYYWGSRWCSPCYYFMFRFCVLCVLCQVTWPRFTPLKTLLKENLWLILLVGCHSNPGSRRSSSEAGGTVMASLGSHFIKLWWEIIVMFYDYTIKS